MRLSSRDFFFFLNSVVFGKTTRSGVRVTDKTRLLLFICPEVFILLSRSGVGTQKSFGDDGDGGDDDGKTASHHE